MVFKKYTFTIKNKYYHGFTLIELLVVIAVIGLLATLVTIGVQNAQTKARDTTRRAEAQQIVKAMELYRANNNGNMMACGAVSSCSGDFDAGNCFSNALAPYMAVLPHDPRENATSNYCYVVCSQGSGCNNNNPPPYRYYVQFRLEETGAFEYLLIDG